MHPERTFTRNDVLVTTSKPATATQLLAEGWDEVVEIDTERPEPSGLDVAINTAGVDEPVTESRSAGRRRRVTAGEPVTPVFDTPPN